MYGTYGRAGVPKACAAALHGSDAGMLSMQPTLQLAGLLGSVFCAVGSRLALFFFSQMSLLSPIAVFQHFGEQPHESLRSSDDCKVSPGARERKVSKQNLMENYLLKESSSDCICSEYCVQVGLAIRGIKGMVQDQAYLDQHPLPHSGPTTAFNAHQQERES